MYAQVFLVGLLAAISPGPDFFIVLKNSLGFGRRVGAASAIGVGTALSIHATYTILGLGVLIRDAILLFKVIQIAGAAYLAYLGISALLASFRNRGDRLPALGGPAQVEDSPSRALPRRIDPPKAGAVVSSGVMPSAKSLRRGFRDGFLTNLLNPKAVVFFLSIFSQFIHPDTPSWVRWVYGAEVVCAVGGWFLVLAYGISTGVIKGLYDRGRSWVDRVFGIVLVGLAGKIVLSTVE